MIMEKGLTTEAARETGTYGKGIYFTDNSCKAFQYADGTTRQMPGCMLICRVVLGRIKLLDRDCVGKRSSPDGYHSFMARKDHTRIRNHVHAQLHNEFVVFDDYACYPEFELIIKTVEEELEEE